MTEFKRYQREMYKHDWIVLPWHQSKTKKPGSMFKWKYGIVIYPGGNQIFIKPTDICILISIEPRVEPNSGFVVHFIADEKVHKSILTPKNNSGYLWLKSKVLKRST